MKKAAFIPTIILFVFLVVGLFIYEDFGVTLDEPNQITAGHVIYKYLCIKIGKEIPEPIKDAPDLYDYKNRYYGQASTFPTVIIEAIRGFSMDTSTIIRIRHLWNFLTYFIGLCCFTLTVSNIYKSYLKSSIGLLLLIFLPRIFGDIFYNDRDTMLLAWLMISLSAFCWYKQSPGFFRGLVCAFCFGMTYNVRLFGLLLLIFPVIFFRSSKNRKSDILVVLLSFCIFYLISPIYWENPFVSIPTSIIHLSTKQRSLETNDLTASQFFGKMVYENNLPWYYIPVYIFITSPLATSFAFLIGCYTFIKKILIDRNFKNDFRTLTGICMMIILFPFMMIVIILRPALYNGWRHFYFLYLPIIWIALEGTDLLFRQKNKIIHIGCLIFLGSSFLCSAGWMVNAHPYHYIYVNPAFRKQWSRKFTKDYWYLTASDAMNHLLNNVESYPIHVVDHDLIKVLQIFLRPAERERFHTYRFPVQPYPIEFQYIHYGDDNDSFLDEVTIDHYSPYYTITRDGVLLAEILQRNHNFELHGSEIIKNISADQNDQAAYRMVDSDYTTAWEKGENEAEITMELKKEFLLSDIEVFPVTKTYQTAPNFRLFSSSDGQSWEPIACIQNEGNNLSFQATKTSWLRLQTDSSITGIYDILFYGN